jgi:hypothetical protein
LHDYFIFNARVAMKICRALPAEGDEPKRLADAGPGVGDGNHREFRINNPCAPECKLCIMGSACWRRPSIPAGSYLRLSSGWEVSVIDRSSDHNYRILFLCDVAGIAIDTLFNETPK